MKNDNRRNFLKKSILGISGASLLPISMNASDHSRFSTLKAALPARTLGKTGISTPLISLGSSGTSSAGFVKAAYDAGIKLFFSATYYGEGNNEKIVGEGLKGLPRNSFFVGTAAPPDDFDRRTGTFTKEFNVESYLRKAEESLKRFGLTYVDIFLFPYAAKREMVLNEGVLKALDTLKKQGKVKFVGIASHNGQEEALKAAAESGQYDVAMLAYNYKIQNRQAMDDALTEAVKAKMGIIGMKTTAGGKGVDTNAALKWVLQNENIATIASGMTNTEELQKNLAMIQNLKMSEQELQQLNMAMNQGESLYCQQCQTCLPECPMGVDIPTIMRGYMYAYGYKNMEQAYYTLEEARLQGNPCENCDTCQVKCISGFDVRAKIANISRLQNVPREFLIA